MPPQLHDGMDPLGGHMHGTGSAVAVKRKVEEDAETTSAIYGDLPESKRRKFILVDDTQRNNRVRVRVTLDQVDMDEMPDSYRKTNSVYPRTYYPKQMQESTSSPRNPRFFEDDGDETRADDENATIGRTMVPVPLLEGGQKIAMPWISRAKKRRENTLNELGYRMSWSQSRVFAGRILFLQKSRE